MLKYRLIFGSLMTLAFVGIVLLDAHLDGSLTITPDDDNSIRGSLLVALVALLIVLGLFELSKLAAAKGAKVLLPVSIPVSILLAAYWYWIMLWVFWLDFWVWGIGSALFFSLFLAFTVMALFVYQRFRYGLSGVLANIGAACFSILYLGLMTNFVLTVRFEFGPWHLLMLVFVVKCSDIGAYTFGRLFGKHKFSPVISPKKTWEGMAGAVVAAVIAAVAFAVYCDIMAWRLGILFGVIFAFLGQMGDLAESMLKRDAQIKDASNNVPGFGGILDVVDSLLVTAPFGYLFFLLAAK